MRRALDLGTKYSDAGDVQRDSLDILKEVSVDHARPRTWNDPIGGHDKDKVLRQAGAVKAKGLKPTVNFPHRDA